ncbi:WecB/TagA/CpsF family glycosyltransferase [Paenarthrobacter sp. NPDC018779]|uniref:WecB/TagA/CpsF family glycosyltransferase n=1 Tax=Paenarthrobacter sp. NPDC018779 TaxID=3364375 RepID=UPI0037CBB5CB
MNDANRVIRRERVFDLPLDLLTMEESVELCHNLLAQRGHWRADLNASIVLDALEDDLLRQYVETSAISNADGQSIVWASRILGVPAPERVSGIDLFLELIKRAPQRGDRVYLLGAREDVVAAVAQDFAGRGVNVVGYRDGYWTPDQESDVVQAIAAAEPDLLFLALPSPRKEHFVLRHKEQLNAGLAFGVGGSFDVISGRLKRAPLWIQKLGLEWCYRFVQEPRRLLKRYLVGNTRFVLLTLRTRLRQRGELKA